jgi:hypothetical protein
VADDVMFADPDDGKGGGGKKGGARGGNKRPLTPAQIKKQLEASGHLVDGAMAGAKPTVCLRCHAVVLRGLTPEPLRTIAVVDPRPLSTLGEFLALRTRLLTYDLAKRAGRWGLEERDAWHIEGSPPDRPDFWRRRGDVVAQHGCGAEFDYVESRLGRVI